MKHYKRSLVIFRRDLRIVDNTALLAAFQHSKEVLACFVFNDQQTQDHRYRSINGFAFLLESLEELERQIQNTGGKLHFFDAESSQVVEDLAQSSAIEAVFVNKDYTPFSRERDKQIAAVCKTRSLAFHSYSDALLVEPSSFGKPDGKPYTVFTPFFKRAMILPVATVSNATPGTWAQPATTVKEVTTDRYRKRLTGPDAPAAFRRSQGGRQQALAILGTLDRHADYKVDRDFPAKDATTILSPHNKFGTVSIREVYWAVATQFNPEHTLIRELYWRDFFTHIAWHFPHVFRGAFQTQYDQLQWQPEPNLLNAWKQGRTGFPIVDAGMRELVATGYMHNRVRMIVASFLVKDLHIDWHEGEAFFARHLTEYDPAVNNGSWQWAASTGCDAQPYFRIFNPWLQQQKFDPQAEYIKLWVPELKELPAKQIHKLSDEELSRPDGYPKPIVDHCEQKRYAEEMFRVITKPKAVNE